MNGKIKNKKAFLLMIPFFILIIIGIWMIYSQNFSSAETTSVPNVIISKHYDGLTNVNIPSDIPSQLKDYEGFTLSFNNRNGTPNWVAWELLGNETSGTQKRTKFWTDNDIKGCPFSKDYTNSGYDRGHMVPAADQKWSPLAMEDCFVMANICPQDHSLNAGAWNTLENKTRTWAQRDSALIIIAGPIYEKTDTIHIGASKVRVPSAFFKVIAAPYLTFPRGIAFVYPNMYSPGNMLNYVMTIREVEEITGFDFLSSLPDDIEEMIETKSDFQAWNVRKQ